MRAGALSNPLADNQTTSREKIKPFQAHDINSSIKNHNKTIAQRNNKNNNNTNWERVEGALSNSLADNHTNNRANKEKRTITKSKSITTTGKYVREKNRGNGVGE